MLCGGSLVVRFALSLATGVGHSFAAIDNGTPAPFPFTPLFLAASTACLARHASGSSPSLNLAAVGVGHALIASVSVTPGLPQS